MRSPLPRILVTGGTGLVGGAVLGRATGAASLAATWHANPPARAAAGGVDWHKLDMRSRAEVDRVVQTAAPDVVLHAAVSVAPEELTSVIVEGSRAVARAAHAVGAGFIHLSSDMVFDGANAPFDEGSRLSPITPYGRAKADAERAVRDACPAAVIARCSLLYRLDPPDRSLAGWLAGLARGDAYPLFTDEIRCPAQVDDVADALLALARRVAPRAADTRFVPPVVHLVGPRALSRHEFGRLVLGALGMDPDRAAPGRSAGVEPPRPRDLRLLTRTTPAWLLAGLRTPEVALAPR